MTTQPKQLLQLLNNAIKISALSKGTVTVGEVLGDVSITESAFNSLSDQAETQLIEKFQSAGLDIFDYVHKGARFGRGESVNLAEFLGTELANQLTQVVNLANAKLKEVNAPVMIQNYNRGWDWVANKPAPHSKGAVQVKTKK